MARLYSIGEVHGMTGFSISALRYYADMKIVEPSRTDRQTGYRYYDFDDIQRLKTVGYLKKAGFSLKEIQSVMGAASEEARMQLMFGRMQQTRQQLIRLQERLEMMQWLTMPNPVEDDHHDGYKIHQKQLPSRRVWMTEVAKACTVEAFYRQTETLMTEEVGDFQKMRGYVLDERTFTGEGQLILEGSFIVQDSQPKDSVGNLSILPQGNYICLTTRIFKDDKWMRALSRYFAEKDIQPRIVLAVLKYKDFYNWRQSLYEVQILI